MADVLVEAPAAAARASLAYPAIAADGLLRAAARHWPDRTAIRFSDGGAAVTFAVLDAGVDRSTAALRRLVGTGGICGVATALDPAFAQAFYAVCRSGNAVVSLNPLHPTAAIVRALRTAGARAAIVTADMRERLAPELPGLPLLELSTLDEATPADVPPAEPGRPARPG
jgi:acyl-CoA synthetase (AMP-forming)/AMP-acid ligase II